MKKLLSIIIAVTMAFSVTAISTVAYATVNSPATTVAPTPTKSGQVNGVNSNDVTYTTDKTNANQITFTYNGNGTLTGWEFPGMVEGTNYQIVSENGNTITILLINNYAGSVVANAITEDETEDAEEEEEEAEKTTAKKSTSSTSPDTGAAGIAGVAIAGVGVAVLAAMKKKDAE